MLPRRALFARAMFARAMFAGGLLPPLIAVPRVRRAVAGVSARVRSGDPDWLSMAEWQALNAATNFRLTDITSPLGVCSTYPEGAACGDLFRSLKNPYAIGDNPALTQASAWLDAWTARPSAYVVAAETAVDVAAAVHFRPRSFAIKRKYDPGGVFFARHGSGSEAWSEDGVT